MAGNTSAENGRKGGRPLGRKNNKTLQVEAEHAQYQQMILAELGPLFTAKLSLAKGLTFVYRISIGPRGGRSEPQLVTDPEEILEAVRMLEPGHAFVDIIFDKPQVEASDDEEDGEIEDWKEEVARRYYILTTKAPDGRVIESMEDRAFGKSVQRIAGGDGGPIQITGVEVSFKKKPS